MNESQKRPSLRVPIYCQIELFRVQFSLPKLLCNSGPTTKSIWWLSRFLVSKSSGIFEAISGCCKFLLHQFFEFSEFFSSFFWLRIQLLKIFLVNCNIFTLNFFFGILCFLSFGLFLTPGTYPGLKFSEGRERREKKKSKNCKKKLINSLKKVV